MLRKQRYDEYGVQVMPYTKEDKALIFMIIVGVLFFLGIGYAVNNRVKCESSGGVMIREGKCMKSEMFINLYD